ncbi:MAG: hypothetical protein ABIO70_18875 [Pseudomonadota bacterium]
MQPILTLLAVVLSLSLLSACGGRAVDDGAVDDGAEPLDPFCTGASSKLELDGTTAPFKEVRASYADLSTPPMAPNSPPPTRHVNGTIVMRVSFNPGPLGPGDYSAEVVVVAPDDGDASGWWQPGGLDLGQTTADITTRVTLTSVSREGNSSARASFSTDEGLQVQGTLRAHGDPLARPTDVRLSLCLSCQHATSAWLPIRLYTPLVGQ